MRLGVVDILAPGWMPELVPHLDALGYERYWTTEHHGSQQSASPIVMAALAAGVSSSLRVGTGGVLLKFCSPLKLVEDFRVLQLMYPGRIDLGIAGGSAPDALAQALLDGRPPPSNESYANKVRDVVRLTRGEAVNGVRCAGPESAGAPTIWLCGASDDRARLAAECGIAFACPASVSGALRAYRELFRPNRWLEAPLACVMCQGICAPTTREAHELWRRWEASCAPTTTEPSCATAHFLGTPLECRDALLRIQEQHAVEEILVQSLTTSFRACLNSYELLAGAFDLPRTSRKPSAAGEHA